MREERQEKREGGGGGGEKGEIGPTLKHRHCALVAWGSPSFGGGSLHDAVASINPVQLRHPFFFRFPTTPPPPPPSYFSAPELILGLRCSEKADIYSLGVTLWEIITRERPRRGEMRDLRPGEVPDAVAALVRACMDPDPKARPSARDVYAALTQGDRKTGAFGDVATVVRVSDDKAAGEPGRVDGADGVDGVDGVDGAAAPPPPPPPQYDDNAPPTPFAVVSQSPFASAGAAAAARDAVPLARRVAAVARAALALAKRRKIDGEEEDEEEDEPPAMAAFL